MTSKRETHGLDPVKTPTDESSTTYGFARRPMLRFALVGGVGFAIESIILTALMRSAHLPAWQARIPSFLTAVLATWLLNRHFTFADRPRARTRVEGLAYGATQLCGAIINFGLFVGAVHWVPALESVPIVPLAIGAAAGFAFNFLISDMLIFRRRRQG